MRWTQKMMVRELRDQACDQLDPEFSKLMTAAADEIERLQREEKYWLEVATGLSLEICGYTNAYPHPPAINGVTLDTLESAVRGGYQTSQATQLDMIALVRRIMTPEH